MPLSRPATDLPVATGFAFDERLPDRDALLDERVMASVLGRALDVDPRACRRGRTKYRVGESLRVVYDLEHRGGSPVRVSLRAFADRQLPTDQREPDVVLESFGALAWVFPNDRKLSALPGFLSDAGGRCRAIGRVVDEFVVMAYAPEKAATVRCSRGGRVLGFAKLYTPNAYLDSSEAYRLLGPHLRHIGLRAPSVLASDPDLGLLFLSPMEGEPLAARNNALDWYHLGRALARFHTLPVDGSLPPFERATMARLTSAAGLIAAARPDCGPAVERLVEALADRLDQTTPEADAVLHGDLHGKNVLAGLSRLAFVDLDQAAVGPPAAELGSAIAALRYGDHSRVGSGRSNFETHLLEGYRASGEAPAPATIAWFTAAATLGERGLRAVNRVRLDGLSILPELIESGHRALKETSP